MLNGRGDEKKSNFVMNDKFYKSYVISNEL